MAGCDTGDLQLLSLFSGPGGLDLGFEQAGLTPCLALDANKAAIETYNWNRKGNPARIADLSLEAPPAVIKMWEEKVGSDRAPAGIIGGPPCQAFSISNRSRIPNDPRAQLPLTYAQILKAFNKRYKRSGPHFFLFENVAGLGQPVHKPSLKIFLDAFEDAGFRVTQFVLDAADFGVPQYRKRMFIIGFNRSRYPHLRFTPPVGDHELVTVREAIGHLTQPVLYARNLDPRKFDLHPNHWCMNPKSKKFTNGMLSSGSAPRRSFRVLRWDERSWTVAYGHREVHVHPNGRRRLSIFEAMLLQGFPPDYELRGTLTDQIRLVSDAVPPPVACALATNIIETIRRYEEGSEKVHQHDNGQSTQRGRRGLQRVAPRSTTA